MILIVDDDKSTRWLLRQKLEKSGFGVIEAKCGAECLNFIHNTKSIALVLLDLKLGDINGFEVLKEIRQEYDSSALPVIVITSEEGNQVKLDAFSLGANDYISKPIQPQELEARVRVNHTLSHIVKSLSEKNLSLDQLKESALREVEQKDSFISSVSHEIRTPLQAVIGACELILEEKNSTKVSDLAELAHGSAIDLLGIVNNILDHGQLKSGKFSISKHEFDLSEMLDKTIRIFDLPAKRKGIKFSCEIKMKHRYFWGDEKRIAQILKNLISNAIKFTQEGGVVFSFKECQKSSTIAIEVRDSGIGIRPDQLKYIFQPFYRTDDSQLKNIEGTGLGLGLAKELVEMMKGEMSVTSELGKGTTFKVTLPLKKCTLETSKLAQKDAQTSFTAIKNKSILFADDNFENLTLFDHYFKRFGHQIVKVENGELALRACIADDYDLVFLDINMPVMGGLEAVSKIIAYQLEKYGKVKSTFIGCSANVFNDQVREMMNSGFDDVLSKPARMNELKNLLLKYKLIEEQEAA